jgi:hypothetical protein
MWARARNGEKAAEALRIFSTCFCLPNSFHANGDQSGTGKSKFTYRPFTLEGNLACAQGIQEMLIQSHNGILRIFPALPKSWTEVSFTELRAEGALVVSAARKGGRTYSVAVSSDHGGHVRMMDPFAGERPLTRMKGVTGLRWKDGFIEFDSRPGGAIELVLQ